MEKRYTVDSLLAEVYQEAAKRITIPTSLLNMENNSNRFYKGDIIKHKTSGREGKAEAFRRLEDGIYVKLDGDLSFMNDGKVDDWDLVESGKPQPYVKSKESKSIELEVKNNLIKMYHKDSSRKFVIHLIHAYFPFKEKVIEVQEFPENIAGKYVTCSLTNYNLLPKSLIPPIKERTEFCFTAYRSKTNRQH